MLWLDHIMHLATHLLFKRGNVFRIVSIPHSQRHTAFVTIDLGIVLPQFLFRSDFVVIGEISQEEKRQHVIAEVIRVHRTAKLIGDVPEGLAELFLVVRHTVAPASVLDSTLRIFSWTIVTK
jgi:hypothetical protein